MVACARCGGLLVRERLFEANGMSSTERVDCERCLNCGALEDTVILTNRYAARNDDRSREPRGPRIHPVGSTALMGHSAHLNYTGACPELEAHKTDGPAHALTTGAAGIRTAGTGDAARAGAWSDAAHELDGNTTAPSIQPKIP